MLIEELYNQELGFHLFELTEEWQVWEMLYCEAQHPAKAHMLIRYPNIVRTFTLLEGEAILAASSSPQNEPEIITLKNGRTYQIQADIWHNIFLKENARILVTESAPVNPFLKESCQLSDEARKLISTTQREDCL